MATISLLEDNKSTTCRLLLIGLPRWFGIASAIETYARQADDLPMLVARDGGAVVGCATIAQTGPKAFDLQVIAVSEACHRQGIGRQLVEAAAGYARQQGGTLLSVKTIGPSYEDEDYAATRAFYESVGFEMLEEFPDFWNGSQPMALYVMRLETP